MPRRETNPWISNIGRPGGPFDFEKHNMKEEKKRCDELEEKQRVQKKKVNEKVVSMIEK